MMANRQPLAGDFVPILAYQSIQPLARPWLYALSPALFEEHLAYLREHFVHSVSVTTSLELQKTASPQPLVLTFDGAFKDFEKVASLLNKYNFTATLFVPTGFVGKKSTWLASAQHRLVLDWEALRTLNNIEIGSLGHGYMNFTKVSEFTAKEDILRSRELLEDKLGIPCQTFAYPDGHFTKGTLRLVQQAGFLAACSLQSETTQKNAEAQQAEPPSAGASVFSLPRIAVTAQLNLATVLGTPQEKNRFPFLGLFRQRWNRLRIPEAKFAPPPLPKTVTLEQVREAWQHEVFSVRPPHPPLVDGATQSDVKRDLLGRHPDVPSYPEARPPIPQIKRGLLDEAKREPLQQYEIQDFEQQGDFLADLSTLLAQQQGKHLSEYALFTFACERLQLAHEAGIFAPERIRSIYHCRAQLEAALNRERDSYSQQQKALLEAYLKKFASVPVPETLNETAKGVKTILDEYLEQLKVNALPEDVFNSVQHLAQSLEHRLLASYRAGLQRLVQEATTIKAMDFLVILQRASNALEQGHYPDLSALHYTYQTIRNAEKTRNKIQERAETFAKHLADAARRFEIVSALNSEEVNVVREQLYHLLTQRDMFPKVSGTMQHMLETSLREAEATLKKLEKDHATTRDVAVQLSQRTHLFDTLFDGEEKKDK